MRLPLVLFFVAAGLASPAVGIAQPLQVDVLESTYTTSLHKQLFPLPPDPAVDETINDTQSHPIANSIQGTYTRDGITHVGEAAASAGTFEVTASANTYREPSGRDNFWSTSATAESFITFSPLADAAVGLLVNYSSFLDSFTKGSISLFDSTANQSLFSHTFQGHGFQEISFNSLFDDDHIYRLSLFAWANANGDSERMSLALSGQVVPPVPEPEAYAMMLVGLVGIGWALRRRARSADGKRVRDRLPQAA